jgi:ubiquinone/menaquinone biosynthesis C-methylase UbiE
MLNKLYKEPSYYNNIDLVREKIKINKTYNLNQKKILDYSSQFAELNKKSKVLEIGCGFALFHDIHPNYIGLDRNPNFPKVAKKLHKKKINLIVADATKIPIKKNQLDFIFSFATIEHIKRPDLVFKEIDRILKKNSVLLLAPAWNCRKYTVQKLQQRSFGELSIALKISKFFIPIQNNLLYRALLKLPSRIYDEYLYSMKRKIKFRYTRLFPSYNLWNKYPPIADDDAVVDMDAHSAILFFISRGYKCISHASFIQRFFCRGSFILLKKLV